MTAQVMKVDYFLGSVMMFFSRPLSSLKYPFNYGSKLLDSRYQTFTMFCVLLRNFPLVYPPAWQYNEFCWGNGEARVTKALS